MNNIGTEVVVGVVTGIVTSLLIFLFLEASKTIILPWYRQFIYKGINISGEWYSTVAPFPQTIKLELDQKANHITGTATYVNEPENTGEIEKIRTFRVEGNIEDRFVEMSLHHTDKSRIGVVSYLFEVVGDGREMQGASSHYDLVGHHISHADISFGRTKMSKSKKYKNA